MFTSDRQQILSQLLQQGKTVLLHVGDDAFGDGAVVERIGDLFAVAGLLRRVVNGNIDHHILPVGYFLLVNADKRTQTQVFNFDDGIWEMWTHKRS